MNYNLTVQQVKDLITSKLSHNIGVSVKDATDEHFYKATALALRDLMSQGYKEFTDKAVAQKKKTVYYLCMEFLLGRSLKNNICNLNLENTVAQALKSLGSDIEKVYDQEPDAGLGNGGLGRLAACFLDGLASQAYPSMGYSLRYEFGIFRQNLVDGWQTELPDNWLPGGSVWLQSHPDKAVEVKFNGNVEETWGDGKCTVKLNNATTVLAVPYDMYVSGNDGKGISRLRLWSAKAEQLDMNLFNDGQYMRAMEQKAMAESITQVLYPGDNHAEGKSLRLNQQYFLVSATIQDILRRHFMNNGTLNELPNLVTLHLNDTHPVLAVPELMRIIMDDYGYGWDEAWSIVSKTIAYTNHTVMREALECWGEDMFRNKLPRIYQIVQELNRRYCSELHSKGVDNYQVGRMAIINDGVVKMANLAVMASYKVNGVSALHSQILKDTVFNDYYKVTPEKFTNVTNGIAHRRWLNQSNPKLTSMITELIGGGFRADASELKKLEKYTDDKAVLEKLAKIKLDNKKEMAKYIKEHNGIIVDPNSIFDVQVKRLHEYKRQLLNALHILTLWQYLRDNPNAEFTPKTFIFGAKAAPGYYFAKQIIQFINGMADKINNDPRVNEKLKVVYLEDYRVTVAEKLMPASEISEQISLAGTEASGTGNMKFMINGALTLGTLDGANVEIHDAVGDENMFLFGMTTPEVVKLKANGYNPMNYYSNNPIIKKAIDELNGTRFAHIAKNLTEQDPYMVLADFADYAAAQKKASEMYKNPTLWNKTSLINIANSGIFAADRAIKDYAEGIWNLKPVE
ncbi:MAG: glycogen/starch/alpha-glucan phosphorylase [Lachnospiraceae bacterium]|nr:glycogen/starch/alpha-glucan phosphorylase [Lachnospiraceae bacterium]